MGGGGGAFGGAIGSEFISGIGIGGFRDTVETRCRDVDIFVGICIVTVIVIVIVIGIVIAIVTAISSRIANKDL